MGDIAPQIVELQALATPALKQRWREVMGAEPPAYARVEILRLGIAYHLQAEAYGGLQRAVRRRLLRIAENATSPPRAVLPGGPRLKPGTRVLRRWGGEVHQVTVLEQGFEYRGTAYGSLSKIARAITGTRWSGPTFFGLTKERRR
jgi:hypothetical protein